MVNPDHNGGEENYQKSSGGGRPGKTDGALLDKLVDPSVLWFSWAYGVTPDAGPGKFSDLRKINDAPELFATHGYDWVGSPWVETANVVAWGKSLRAAVRTQVILQCLAIAKPCLTDRFAWWVAEGRREAWARDGAG
eukprot:COSAG06_NODE_1090_length_10746_cov_5.415892_12_plen_137_part_00